MFIGYDKEYVCILGIFTVPSSLLCYVYFKRDEEQFKKKTPERKFFGVHTL